uniref:Uncharacterized protein n=1 Tax=Arundo donax TaxID=35708 RepID=A0A0A8YF46_ARUDO
MTMLHWRMSYTVREFLKYCKEDSSSISPHATNPTHSGVTRWRSVSWLCCNRFSLSSRTMAPTRAASRSTTLRSTSLILAPVSLVPSFPLIATQSLERVTFEATCVIQKDATSL